MIFRQWWCAAVMALLLTSCSAGDDLGIPGIVEPEGLVVEALSIRAVKVEWVAEARTTYHLERRVNLVGPFEPMTAGVIPAPSNGRVTFVDDNVEPNTYYGYRLRASTTLGETSEYSPIRGARTPPLPGIAVTTTTSGNYSDPNGYVVSFTGPGSGPEQTMRVGTAERRVSPTLAAGTYTVALHDVDPLCSILGNATHTADVDDSGMQTVTDVTYDLTCRDPTKGQITVTLAIAGGGVNASAFTLKLEGLLDGGGAAVQTQTVPAAGGTTVFNNLRPGNYQVMLSGVSSDCEVADGTTREAMIQALDTHVETFNLTCERPDVDPNQPGYKLRGTWSPVENGMVTYTLALDMGAFNDPVINGAGGDDISTISAVTRFDATKLTFVESQNAATGAGLINQSSGLVTTGAVAWFNYASGSTLLTGVQPVIRLVFSVNTGATGTVTTFTAFGPTDDILSKSLNDLKPRLVILDQSLNLSGGGPAASLTAAANGSYAGTAGAPISFSAAGSSAPPGRTITSYEWSFSDGGSGTGGSVQHTFATAGTFTATLTVRDNQGGVDTDAATVTVNAASGGGIPANKYGVVGTWGTISGGQVTYTLKFDLTHRDDPAITGLDDLGSISGTTMYDATKLDFVSSANAAGSLLRNQAGSEVAPGRIDWLNFNSDVSNATGTVGVITLTFNVLSGATGSVAPVTSFGTSDDIMSLGGVNLKPHTVVLDGTLALSSVGGGTGSGTGSAQPLTWRNEFGSVDPATGLVTLTVTLDLSADIPETAGPEAVRTFVLDSVKWDASVLQYRGYSLLGENTGTVQTGTPERIIVLNGITGTANTSGMVGILQVRFAPIGASGRSTTTRTFLKSLTGTDATGPYHGYLAKTKIVEGTFTHP